MGNVEPNKPFQVAAIDAQGLLKARKERLRLAQQLRIVSAVLHEQSLRRDEVVADTRGAQRQVEALGHGGIARTQICASTVRGGPKLTFGSAEREHCSMMHFAPRDYPWG